MGSAEQGGLHRRGTQQDYLSEFQKIAEIDTLGPIAETPGA